jgi:ferrous iron transport protein A
MVTSLRDLKPGQSGRIIKVEATGPIRRRLFDLGIRSGEIVRMIRIAPLRDPLEISLGNGHISLRRSEAALITVEVLPSQ